MVAQICILLWRQLSSPLSRVLPLVLRPRQGAEQDTSHQSPNPYTPQVWEFLSRAEALQKPASPTPTPFAASTQDDDLSFWRDFICCVNPACYQETAAIDGLKRLLQPRLTDTLWIASAADRLLSVSALLDETLGNESHCRRRSDSRSIPSPDSIQP